MRAPRRAALRGTVLAAALLPIVAGVALAHPLGNFTINHYAGIRVEPGRVLLDVVIDEAEIPTFQASQAFDLDGDGALSAAETTAARQSGCVGVGRDLRLAVGGSAARLLLVEAGLAFPAGNGGLSTMRLACTFEAPLSTPVGSRAAITFEDGFEASRIGWREIAVVGSGVTVEAPGIPTTSLSGRLTAYPGGLAAAPSVRTVSFSASPGGAPLPQLDVPDADPIGPIDVATGAAIARSSDGQAPGTAPSPAAAPTSAPIAASVGSSTTSAAIPGGEGSIPDALRSAPATPLIALVALLTAAALGAGHALTPGHGKTLMAAYLVGTRGTPRHAVGLGLAVSVSHTLGILGLAAVVLAAESTLPPDLVVRVAPLVAAVSIVVIGGWMLLTEVRRGLAARHAHAHAHAHAGDHDHGHAHDHDDARAHDHGPAGEHGTGHGSDREHGDAQGHGPAAHDGLEHSHGGVRHRHVPAAGSTISWRSLFVLGLAGGLVPSASALLILLATIAAGRPAWGVILVAAFGLGMAGVMAGVGLAFVHARGLLERAPSQVRATRAVRLVPAGAAALVLAVGVVLTTQAISVVGLG